MSKCKNFGMFIVLAFCCSFLLTSCEPSTFVFVTEWEGDGNIGGLTAADSICQTEADDAGLPGTYKAWLSDSTASPSSRFCPT